MFADLDEHVYGVWWWAPQCSEPGRVRNSDHLWKCIHGIAWNLVEARLVAEQVHLGLETEREFVNAVTNIAGQIEAAPRLRKNALELLSARHTGMNISSFFVKLGSALDCLASAIAGVTALGGTFFAGLPDVRSRLKDLKGGSPGRVLQIDFRTKFEALITDEKIGPADWHDWVQQYRNMVVHRARRQIFAVSRMRDARVEGVSVLTAQPGLSDMEIFLMKEPLLLSEPVECTIEGAFKSTVDLAEATCALLLDVWRQRRADPAILAQPDDWPPVDGKPKRLAKFVGYAPKTLVVPDTLRQVPPELARRLRAAGLLLTQT